MKNILLMSFCAAALLASACGKDDDNGTKTPSNDGSFVGTLDVAPMEGSHFTAFSEKDITFEMKEQNGGMYTLFMPKIKFVEQMPVYISFEVRSLKPVFDGEGYTFSVAETLPYRNGAVYVPDGDGKYTIRNMQGENVNGTTLQVTFECYGMTVDYTGTKK